MSVYNGEKYLREAIDSILGQTFKDFEFLIIDDGSTDSSVEIIRSYADPRIRLIQNEENIGLSRSLNKGLKLAIGEYIARMDADDISLPRRLAAQVGLLDKQPDIGLVGTSIQLIDCDGERMHVHRVPTTHAQILWALCFTTPLAHPSVVFRKVIIECVGGYSEELVANQDRDLWQRLSSITRFANLPEVYLLYRWHDHNISHRHAETQAYNSAKAGQRMMSGILGYEVPFELCHNIRLGRFETLDDAVQAALITRSIYDAFVAKQALSVLEKLTISKDAANRLFRLAWSWRHEARMWKFFAASVQLDPLVVARALGARAKRKAVNTAKKGLLVMLQAVR